MDSRDKLHSPLPIKFRLLAGTLFLLSAGGLLLGLGILNNDPTIAQTSRLNSNTQHVQSPSTQPSSGLIGRRHDHTARLHPFVAYVRSKYGR